MSPVAMVRLEQATSDHGSTTADGLSNQSERSLSHTHNYVHYSSIAIASHHGALKQKMLECMVFRCFPPTISLPLFLSENINSLPRRA
uniref:Uncharacterized protein n=1 Tax=Arundo donax TaxID=35708 RepID=A0A0A9DAZ2_ARUDO